MLWSKPVCREMFGAEAEIQRAYRRFSPDHPMHRLEPNYAPDYTSEGARVLTWRPIQMQEPARQPTPEPAEYDVVTPMVTPMVTDVVTPSKAKRDRAAYMRDYRAKATLLSSTILSGTRSNVEAA